MKIAKYLIFLFLLLLSFKLQASNPIETLHYVISYKWGLIHKDSGDATITMTPKNNGYELKLTGKTRPWADKLFKVRDTLISDVGKDRFMPTHYTKIAHENGKYSRDDISFKYNGHHVTGHSKKFRQKKDGSIKMSEQDLEGENPVYDMLSVFFFLRNIDYSSLTKGETVKTTLFSGTMVEKLTVKCLGKEKIKLKDKSEREAWHIVFNFTSGGGKKSSDDIDCWISTDSSHIPLLVVGSLPLGQVRCTYVP
ncbi:MAG: DUF3108 domain-containing protein [Muribaculaceae bacterium]|nr:DUF3108 domain-containing protein [Muribaculaceae bacterium]